MIQLTLKPMIWHHSWMIESHCYYIHWFIPFYSFQRWLKTGNYCRGQLAIISSTFRYACGKGNGLQHCLDEGRSLNPRILVLIMPKPWFSEAFWRLSSTKSLYTVMRLALRVSYLGMVIGQLGQGEYLNELWKSLGYMKLSHWCSRWPRGNQTQYSWKPRSAVKMH